MKNLFRVSAPFCISIVLALASFQTQAQEDTASTIPEEDRFGDWIRLCETPPESDAEICGLVQNVLLKESGKSILKVIFRRHADADSILLNLPLGFALPPGVGVQIDKAEPEAHVVQTCTQTGCLVGWEVKAEYLGLMKKGAQMTVIMVMLDGKPFEIPISLSGFTKGYNSISPS